MAQSINITPEDNILKKVRINNDIRFGRINSLEVDGVDYPLDASSFFLTGKKFITDDDDDAIFKYEMTSPSVPVDLIVPASEVDYGSVVVDTEYYFDVDLVTSPNAPISLMAGRLMFLFKVRLGE
jgi:hypothetical protein